MPALLERRKLASPCDTRAWAWKSGAWDSGSCTDTYADWEQGHVHTPPELHFLIRRQRRWHTYLTTQHPHSPIRSAILPPSCLPLHPSTWISRCSLHKFSPDEAVGRKNRFFLMSHTSTTTQRRTGKTFGSSTFIVWRRMKTNHQRKKSIQETPINSGVHLSMGSSQKSQTKQLSHPFFVCFSRNRNRFH